MHARTPLQRAVPAARTIDLVTTQSNDEVLVYDQQSHHIHHLNAQAVGVWRLCDGSRTVDEISIAAGLDETAVRIALGRLEDAHLLDGKMQTGLRVTQSRRALIRKAAIAGALPAIISVSAPIAASASSHCSNRACYDHSDCSDQISGCGGCSNGVAPGQRTDVTPEGVCLNPGGQN